jgi:hypothetical protein
MTGRWRPRCPTSLLAPAASAAVPNEANTMASAMNIGSNATVSTTGRDETMSHATFTTRLPGNAYGRHSWRPIRCAGHAKRTGVLRLQPLSITECRSSTEAHRSIGQICNPYVARATRGSQSKKGVGGQGVGPPNSLGINELDRRAGTVCISAK